MNLMYTIRDVMIWLLALAAIFSFVNLFLFIKLLKKFDDSQILITEAFELLNNNRIKIEKEIDILKRRSRIISNETKEKNRQ